MKPNFVAASLLVTSAVFSTPLLAQSGGGVHPWLEDDFIINMGVFLPSKDFTISVDGENPGAGIDFNESADVSSDESTFGTTFTWRFGEKWSVAGQYYSTSDDGQAVLTEDVTWGDNVLRAGSFVGAGVELDIARVFLGRTFFTEAKHHEFGMGVGIHWLQISAFLEGEMFVNDESRGFQRESVSDDLPLPNVGAWYWYSLSDRWLLTSRVDWLSASIGDYSGGLWNASVGVNFQAWDHISFGLAYQYFSVDVDVDTSDWAGSTELSQHGPFLSVGANW